MRIYYYLQAILALVAITTALNLDQEDLSDQGLDITQRGNIDDIVSNHDTRHEAVVGTAITIRQPASSNGNPRGPSRSTPTPSSNRDPDRSSGLPSNPRQSPTSDGQYHPRSGGPSSTPPSQNLTPSGNTTPSSHDNTSPIGSGGSDGIPTPSASNEAAETSTSAGAGAVRETVGAMAALGVLVGAIVL